MNRTILASTPLPRLVSGRYFYTSSPHSNTTSVALTTGTLRLVPWVSTNGLSIDRIGAEVTTIGDAGSKLRLGVYADNGSGYPGALLLDAGQIAGDSATVQELTCSLSLSPGLYWVGGVVQSVTTAQPTVRTPNAWGPPVPVATGTAIPGSNVNAIGYLQASVTAALPSTFSTSVNSSGLAPRVFVRTA